MTSEAWQFDRATVDVSGDVTFVVARRSRAGAKLRGYKVEASRDAIEDIRTACTATLDLLGQRSPRAYEPSIEIEPEHEYLAIPSGDVRSAELPRRQANESTGSETPPSTSTVEPPIETDPQVSELLGRASGLERLPAPDLRRFTYLFYAAVVGSDPAIRSAFVRKRNPAVTIRAGRKPFAYGNVLHRVDDPLLLLDSAFDLVISVMCPIKNGAT